MQNPLKDGWYSQFSSTGKIDADIGSEGKTSHTFNVVMDPIATVEDCDPHKDAKGWKKVKTKKHFDIWLLIIVIRIFEYWSVCAI